MASLAAAVASLAARSVDGTSVWRGAVTRDMAKLAASVALHSLSLAVACKVVWSSALVASSCASPSESAAASKAPARWSTKTSTRWGWDCGARSWAVALIDISNWSSKATKNHIQQGGQPVHKSSSDRRPEVHRSDEGLGSQLEHVQDPGSGSTV